MPVGAGLRAGILATVFFNKEEGRMPRGIAFPHVLSMLSLVLPHPARALPLPELESSAFARVETSSQLCATDSSSSLFCNIDVLVADFPGTGGETTGTERVEAFAEDEAYSRVLSIDPMGNPVVVANVPGTGTRASASAQTDFWVNRASASASGDRAISAGEDLIDFAHETRYTDTFAEAQALSRWLTHLTFAGGSGSGSATLQFAISGGAEAFGALPSGAEFRFALIDPGASDHEGDDVLVAEEFFGTSESGPVAFDLRVDLPFHYGRTYLAVGELSVLASGGGGTQIVCEGAAGPCVVAGPVFSSSDYDFFSTVAATRLIVPPGTLAFGPEGASLPFSVVPGPALLPTLALALAALGSARCLRQR
jgi:hypothetical protein